MNLIKSLPTVFFISFMLAGEVKSQPRMFKREMDPLLTPRDHPLDFQDLRLDINIEPKEGLVKGKATHIFTPLRSKVDNFFLDAKEGLTIKEAQLNGAQVVFKRDTAGYQFFPATELSYGNKYTLIINYEARPKKGLYFVGWNDSLNISHKQVWSQGQGIDNRYWIPMYDEMNDKLISEINITFNKDYKVLSNGAKLLEKENPDGTKTWRYRMTMPHAPYLIMLAIGKYEIKEIKSKSGVPIRLYYYPEHKERVDVMYKYSSQMMDFLEKEIGIPYPWKTTYSQIPVQDYMFGAMENTTATVFGDFYAVDARAYLDRNYVSTNAHELTHMWFGDLITARSASDSWLQESFATHYQWLYDREVFGQDQFDWNRKNAINQSLAASVNDKKAIAHSEAGSTRWYPKGAFVIEMIKYMVGRDQYNRAIKAYLEKNAYKNVDSNELLIAFQDALGMSLNWFWDEWIYKGGEPHYKVSYQDSKNNKNERATDIFVEQIQELNDLSTLFKMPIRMEVYYRDGSKDTARAWIENQFHKISIPNKNNMEIDFVLFDPNSQIMKSVSFHKFQEELINQALRAPNMLDRYDAIVSLRGVDLAKKRETLISVFVQEKFHAVKTEIISQLVSDTAKSSIDLLRRTLSDKDATVRKSAILHIQTNTTEIEQELRKLLKDSSYVAVEYALDKLASKYPENIPTCLDLTKNEVGNSGRNIRIKWLEIACNTDRASYLPELISYTSQSYEFRTRINAIETIRRIGHCDTRLLAYLANAAAHYNTRLAAPAEQLIQYLYKQNANKKMMNDLIAKGVLLPKEKAALLKNMK